MIERHPTQSLPRLEKQLEQSLHRLRHELSALTHRLNVSPEYMGMLSLFWRRQAIVAAAAGRPPALVRQLLEYHCAFGTSHFAFAAGLSNTALLTLEGRVLNVRNRPDLVKANRDISFWKLDLASAMILRDAARQGQLLEAAPGVYGPGFAQLPTQERLEPLFLSALAGGKSPQAEAFLQQWVHQEITRKTAARSQPKLPLLEVWLAVLGKNREAFNTRLEAALKAHHTYWSQQVRGGRDLEGLVALPLVHACAWAHDHGLSLEVDSDYLPPYLIAHKTERKPRVRRRAVGTS
ncbi:MAG: immunity 49 family protein [Meiothermus sp.]|nr:immunity 49 family protein [Meiothermus sp.]